MMKSETVRIRYSRDTNRVPKNTLATMRVEGKIYFGIARCHSKLDRFRRDAGTDVACGRLMLAVDEGAYDHGVPNYQLHAGEYGDMFVHCNKLRGVVHVDDVKELLDYFDRIDDICLYGDK